MSTFERWDQLWLTMTALVSVCCEMKQIAPCLASDHFLAGPHVHVGFPSWHSTSADQTLTTRTECLMLP